MIITDQRLLTLPSTSVSKREAQKIFHQLMDVFTIVSKNGQVAGLAAPQIGIHKRVFIIHHRGSIMHFYNPVIDVVSYEIISSIESCLSIPNRMFVVPRYKRIQVFNGEKMIEINDTFLSTAIQHEFDHLNGITLLQSGTPVEEVKGPYF